MSEGVGENIAAIIVTYNRKQPLGECLNALLSQTHHLDAIYIIDNASTDDTPKYLIDKGFLDKPLHPDKEPLEEVKKIQLPRITDKTVEIHYVRMHENRGFSGGLHEGVKRGYETGFDWLWLMDDDAMPKCDCLENLYDVIQILSNEKVCIYACHLDSTEEYFTESIAVYESDEPLCMLETYGEALQKGRLLQATGGPFLGVLIPSQAIIEVGLPRMDTFIWGDYEYFVRLREHGFKIYYDTKSILIHPKHSFRSVKLPLNLFSPKKPICITFQWPNGPAWKHYYGIRNKFYFGIREKNGSNILQFIKRFIKGIVPGIICSYIAVRESLHKFRTFRYCLLGIIDGCIGRMNRKVNIV